MAHPETERAVSALARSRSHRALLAKRRPGGSRRPEEKVKEQEQVQEQRAATRRAGEQEQEDGENQGWRKLRGGPRAINKLSVGAILEQ